MEEKNGCVCVLLRDENQREFRHTHQMGRPQSLIWLPFKRLGREAGRCHGPLVSTTIFIYLYVF